MKFSKKKIMAVGSIIAAAGLLARSATRHRYSFRNKSVLITGGSRGLGLVLARILVEEGADLTIISRNAQTLDTAASELRSLGARVLAIECDVRKRGDAENAVRRAVDHYGSLDVLINNAGVIQVGPFNVMTFDDFEDAMATHTWGPLFMISAAIPHLRGRGGRIVYVSSIGGKIAVPHLLPYTVSKFALSGLSDGLRSELASDGILVTSVYPGLMRTGSHVNANFKGDHEKEFAWFSVIAGLPLSSINVKRAARQIVEACRAGAPELIITTQARIAVLVNALFPSVTAAAMKVISAVLPRSKTIKGQESWAGWDSASTWSPSTLTRLADDAIEQNNEYPAA